MGEYAQWRSGRFARPFAANRAARKDRFCLFLYNLAAPWRVHDGERAREDFCRKLARYKPVDCPGRALHNMHVPGFGPTMEQAAPDLDPWALRARYKFAIAFESQSGAHYLTEKIRMALLAGSVPIYWGCPRVAEYINLACFVNCHDYPDFDAVVERVKEIDQSAELYEKYRRAPLLLPDSKLRESAPARLAAFMDGVVARALARRRSRGAGWTPADRLRYAALLAACGRRALKARSRQAWHALSRR